MSNQELTGEAKAQRVGELIADVSMKWVNDVKEIPSDELRKDVNNNAFHELWRSICRQELINRGESL